MTIALAIAAIVVVSYLLLMAGLWRYQERIVFQPPAWPIAEPADGIARLEFEASDGVRLFALLVGDPASSGPVVVAFHGNAVVARWLIPWAREVVGRFGARVVLAEYRGYDGLRGTPTYAGAALDARACLEATCRELNIDATEIMVFGHSLGTAVAGELASAIAVKGLLLQAPFSSALDMAARWPVVGLARFWPIISRVHYDTVERVRTLDARVHVAHGERDIVIPARMGREVFAAAQRPGGLLVLPDAGHNDVPESGGDRYWHWFREALAAEAR